MSGLLLAALLAVPTPVPILPTATPAPISERAALETGVAAAVARAQSIGAMLGVSIVDVTTGASAGRNGDANLPMGGVQRLVLAVLAYDEIDAGQLPPSQGDLISRMLFDNDAAAKTVTGLLGGTESANAQLRALGFPTIFIAPGDGGYATPDTLARFLNRLVSGELLSPAYTKALLDTLARVQTSPGRLRAGLPQGTRLAHKAGTTADSASDVGVAYVNGRTLIIVAMLHDGHGTDTQRDAVISAAAQAAAGAASARP